MIETVQEYQDLLKRLRELKAENKLSRSVKSKLEGLEECEQLVKNFGLGGVSNQREPLIAFCKGLGEDGFNRLGRGQIETVVDNHIKAINCG